MWSVKYSATAAKAMGRLPRNVADIIQRKIEGIAADPYAPNNNVIALKGEPGFRLRVGDWRVVYLLYHDMRIMVVVRIAPRGSAYR